jgi:hypothetical protein
MGGRWSLLQPPARANNFQGAASGRVSPGASAADAEAIGKLAHHFHFLAPAERWVGMMGVSRAKHPQARRNSRARRR